MSKGPVAVLVAFLGLALPAGAESVYVVDQLLLGVHEQKERQSAILELLPSGTRLDVLKRDGDFVRVKTPGGTSGWVDSKYLMSEKPARISLSELETQHQKAKQSLNTAREELKALRARRDKGIDDNTREQLRMLRSENAALKETIASAEDQLTELARAQAAETEAAVPEEPTSTTELSLANIAVKPATWGVLGAMFVLGLVLGTYLMDYRQRRRHGGFRI